MEKTMENRVVSPADWLTKRKELLAKEKEFARLREELCVERRALPWVKLTKNYVFDSPYGKITLQQLFKNRSQLIVYHFMFGPGWEEGCPGCSLMVDHVEGALVHLENHDISYVAVSRAPLAVFEPFKKRMGWRFNWVSSFENDFNYDFHVSFTKEEVAKGEAYYNFGIQPVDIDELPGLSVFYKDDNGDIFHTYSVYGNGTDEVVGSFMYLDFTPKGRNENGPFFDQRDWVRHHDKYGNNNVLENILQPVIAEKASCCSGVKEDAA